MFDDSLRFRDNTDVIVKKAQQHLFCLRKLNCYGVDQGILTRFPSFIENILTFSFISWFTSLCVSDKKQVERVVMLSSKIIGKTLLSLVQLNSAQIRKKAYKMMDGPHVVYDCFTLMPSGMRFRLPVCKTNRRRSGFIPEALRLANCLSTRNGQFTLSID